MTVTVQFARREDCERHEFNKWKERVTIPVYGKRNKKLDIRKGDETHDAAVRIVIRNEQDLNDIKKLQNWYGYYGDSVAINWLREEHDIFYTPGMEAPKEDFNVDEAAREYEKATRRDRVEELRGSWSDIIAALQKRLSDAKRRTAELEKSIAEKDSHIEALKADRYLSERLVKEQREFITKVAELLETKDPYIEREYTAAINALSNIVKHPNRYRWLYTELKEGMESVLQEAEEKED